jgi:putative flippase GtrA
MADELHGVAYRYPLPGYIKSRKDDLPKYASIGLIAVLAALLVVFVLVKVFSGAAG